MNATTDFAPASEAPDGPTRFHRVHLSADAHTATTARSDLDTWLQAHFALSPTDRVGLLMAVYEAVANAVEHAYLGSPDGVGTFDVDSVYDSAQDTLTVVVADHGCWLAPDAAPGPHSTRGRGIHMMRALADHASISATPVGTQVSLTWLQLHHRPQT